MKISVEHYWKTYCIEKPTQWDIEDIKAVDMIEDFINLMICAGYSKETVQKAINEFYQ